MLVLFFFMWVVFNGQLTLEIAIFGLIISLAVLLFTCKYMDYSLKKEILMYRMLGQFLRYFFVLFVEIVKANWCVIRLLFTFKEEIEPALVEFDVPLKSKFTRVLLANSITLTPGTITVSLEGEHYQVHCLDKSLGVGIDDSIFVKLLFSMEQAMGYREGKKEEV